MKHPAKISDPACLQRILCQAGYIQIAENEDFCLYFDGKEKVIVDKDLVGAMEKRQNLIIIRDIIDGIKIIKEVPSWVREVRSYLDQLDTQGITALVDLIREILEKLQK